ncbi:DoxX family membrane protein [Candidatus Woesearchaeota archaeon]|nr:DoxX family membrane protein [Candidatus Woesearchaeota archaeon]
MVSLKTIQPYAPAVLRISISLVFLWFGLNQLILPDNFMGYLPDFLLQLDYAKTLIYFNGAAEVILGTMLLIGFLVRPVALLLALHLLTIAIGLGYNDIMIRDLGLTLATVSIFLGGADIWTIDSRRKNRL